MKIKMDRGSVIEFFIIMVAFSLFNNVDKEFETGLFVDFFIFFYLILTNDRLRKEFNNRQNNENDNTNT